MVFCLGQRCFRRRFVFPTLVLALSHTRPAHPQHGYSWDTRCGFGVHIASDKNNAEIHCSRATMISRPPDGAEDTPRGRRPNRAHLRVVLVLAGLVALVIMFSFPSSGDLRRKLQFNSFFDQCGPHDSQWTPVDALLDVDFKYKVPAPGCSLTGSRRCTLNDVFDEIIVLSLPRRKLEATRIRNQLRELGVRHTLVHAFDKRSASMQALAQNVLSVQQKAGVLALYKTQLAVFDYIQRSPFERFLILEDDVLLRRDFPAAFDAGIRHIPTDWRILFLGANVRSSARSAQWAAGGWWPETFASNGFYRPRNVWSSWAIAVHRDAAKVRPRACASANLCA